MGVSVFRDRRSLAIFSGAAVSAQTLSEGVVLLPDPRVRARISFVFDRRGSLTTYFSAQTPVIWLWAGIVPPNYQAAGDQVARVADLDGTTLSGVSFPTTGLSGYSREWETTADAIGWVITAPVTITPTQALDLYLDVELSPSPGYSPCEVEWTEIVKRYSVRAAEGRF